MLYVVGAEWLFVVAREDIQNVDHVQPFNKVTSSISYLMKYLHAERQYHLVKQSTEPSYWMLTGRSSEYNFF